MDTNELLIWVTQNCWSKNGSNPYCECSRLAGLFGTRILSYKPISLQHLDLDHLPFLDLSNFKFHFHSFFNQHWVLYFVFTSSTLPCCFQNSSLDSHPSSPLPAWSGYSLSQATELHFHGPAVESHPVQLPYRWPSTGARSPRHPGWVRWSLGRSSFIMESYNDVLMQCHLSLFIYCTTIYTLYIRAHDERRMLMGRCFVDFYFGWIHIEHHLEVRWDCKSLVKRVGSVLLVLQ